MSNTRFHCLQYIHAVRDELGGVVRAAIALCENLAWRGHRVTLLTGDIKDVPPAWVRNEPGCPHAIEIELPRIPLTALPRSTVDVVGRLMADAQVLHMHTLWDTVNLTIARLANSRQVPYVISSHGMLDDYAYSQRALKKRLFMRVAGKRFLEKAVAIHCTAEGERLQVARHISKGRYFVIPHYFDWSLFQSLPGPELARGCFPALSTDKSKILFLSRLHPIKGADVLIEAVARAKSNGMDSALFLAGPEELGQQVVLERLAESLGISSDVHFLGMVRGKEKVSLYQACDLFALPTRQENFGIVLAEAMAAELPLVTTPQVDIWPELEQAGGRIVERTPAAFAAAIQELLTDQAMLSQLGKKGRQTMLRWLDPETISNQFEQMYQQCMASESGRAPTPGDSMAVSL